MLILNSGYYSYFRPIGARLYIKNRRLLGSGLSYFSGATVYSENRTTSKVVPLWPCLSNRIRRVWHLHDDGASWKSTDI